MSHPSKRRKAFSVVLAVELWERFGYYGMQAVLTLFMVGHLHLQDQEANLMQGALALLVYSLPVIGGVLGDYILGTRQTLLTGALGLTAGYGVLAFSLSHEFLFLPALALIALSNGLFKPNAGALVRRIYEGQDAALDAAFTLYYMSINVGSTVSMLLMPWVQLHFGPIIAFGGCALGLIIGITYYLLKYSTLSPFFEKKKREDTQKTAYWAFFKGGKKLFLIFPLLGLWWFSVEILSHAILARFCVMISILGMCFLWLWFLKSAKSEERAGLCLAYILSIQTMGYQIFYQQMQTSLTLFALRSVSGDYKIAGFTLFHMSAGQFQALNPIWIMVFSPILAYFYNKWAQRGHHISSAYKIICGYSLIALGFLLWWLSAKNSHGLVSPWVMLGGYGAVSLGELLTIGLGLAIIARYVPERIGAILMGTVYLLWGVGMYLGSLVANLAALPETSLISITPSFYAPLFRGLFLGAVSLCVILVALLPLIVKLERLHAKLIVKK